MMQMCSGYNHFKSKRLSLNLVDNCDFNVSKVIIYLPAGTINYVCSIIKILNYTGESDDLISYFQSFVFHFYH